MNKTDLLIEQLSAAPRLNAKSVNPRYWGTLLLVSLPIAALALWVFYQAGAPMRADYMGAIAYPLVAVKQLVPMFVMLTAVLLSIMLMRPETTIGKNIWPLALGLLILPGLMAWALMSAPSDARLLMIQGNGFIQCLGSILALSLGLTTTQLVLLRRGAVTKPMTAGALAGISSGAIGAVIYAFICTEDSPAFYGLWYTLGIVSAGAVGSFAGKFFLRW